MIDAVAGHIDWAKSPPFGRRVSLMHTLEILRARRGNPLIVELGTSHAYSPDGLGNALLAFAWYGDQFGARVISVEVHDGGIEACKNILREYAPDCAHIPRFVHADCFDWAAGCHEPIDLLYMDAMMELYCDPTFSAFAKRFVDRVPSFYLELYNRFDRACFPSGSLMLFDDTQPDGEYWGKGIFAIPYLLQNGWRQVNLRGVPVFPMVLLEKA